MKDLTIRFQTKEELQIFMEWLDYSGEKIYLEENERFDKNGNLINHYFIYDYENSIINEPIRN